MRGQGVPEETVPMGQVQEPAVCVFTERVESPAEEMAQVFKGFQVQELVSSREGKCSSGCTQSKEFGEFCESEYA